MKLEWDEKKRQKTLQDRGLDFADCASVFDGPTVSYEDTREDYGEQRIVTVGVLQGRMVLIVHTDRDDAIRIISMRKANAREEAEFAEFIGITPRKRRRPRRSQ